MAWSTREEDAFDVYEDEDEDEEQQEVEQDEDEEENDEDDEGDDRPWEVTKATLAEIDEMSPAELKGLIENVGQHERWQDLREEATRRTSQWLSGLQKAEAAPRCQFVKADGASCGSPALKGETLCHYHAQAQARRAAEEARKLEMTPLDDRASIQLARCGSAITSWKSRLTTEPAERSFRRCDWRTETSETWSHCYEHGISRRQSRDLPSKRSGSPVEIPRDPHGIGRDLGA